MRFEAAWIWLLLPPLLVWVWWLSRRSYAHLSPGARWASAALRVLVLVCLLGALSRPVLVRRTTGQHLLFLLDVSRSVSRENLEAALSDIDRLASDALGKGGHRLSVIAFGREPRLLLSAQRSWPGWKEHERDLVLHETSVTALNARLAQLITQGAPKESQDALANRIKEIEAFRQDVVGEQTDARAAIRLALNTGAVDEAKTLYLFTDANFNRGVDAAGGGGGVGRGPRRRRGPRPHRPHHRPR